MNGSDRESESTSRQDSRPQEQSYQYILADIRERDGAVPLWLILVIIGLLIWAVYYTMTYWSPPGSGS